VYEDYAGGGGDPEWCAEYCVNRPALAKAVHIRAQLKRYLEMLCKEKSIQSCQGDIQKIQKALVAGFFSQAARIGPDGKYRTVRNGTEVTIHPSSVFAKFGAPAEHIIFHEAVFTDQVYVRDATAVRAAWLLEAAPHFYQAKQTNDTSHLKRRKMDPTTKHIKRR